MESAFLYVETDIIWFIVNSSSANLLIS